MNSVLWWFNIAIYIKFDDLGGNSINISEELLEGNYFEKENLTLQKHQII